MEGSAVTRVPTGIWSGLGGDREYEGTEGGWAAIQSLTSASFFDASLPSSKQSVIAPETSITRGAEKHTCVLYRLNIDGSLGSRSTVLPYKVDEVLRRI